MFKYLTVNILYNILYVINARFQGKPLCWNGCKNHAGARIKYYFFH